MTLSQAYYIVVIVRERYKVKLKGMMTERAVGIER